MQETNFWNLLFVYRYKIILLLLVSALGVEVSMAQTRNLELFDYSKKIHFGFTIGTNYANFKYDLSEKFYLNDSLNTIDVKRYPGITLGAIMDIHIKEFFDIRLIPSLVLTQRDINFTFKNGYTIVKPIESIFAEIPLLVKFKSTRHGNVRFYVIGGAKVAYDFGSESKVTRDPDKPIIAIDPWNYYYEYGCGLDMYFFYFKFSPEVKLSKGINNILAPFDDDYSGSFSRLRSNMIFFSLNFEG
jgi:hypothetical protein